MTKLIILIDNNARLNDMNELDLTIRELYDINGSHINHMYNNSEKNKSEYVYEILEGQILNSKDLIPLLRFEYVYEFYILS